MKAQLEISFGNCKFSHNCICLFKDSFEASSETIFYVYDEGGDSQQPVKIVSKNEKFQLTVNNETNKQVCLTKTDKCLFTDETSKCDCLLFDDVQLYFIEIKSCSSGSRSNRRRTASNQLRQTIEHFRLNNIDFSKYKATALICFKSVEPKIIQASRNSASAIFKEQYGVLLEEGNVINF